MRWGSVHPGVFFPLEALFFVLFKGQLTRSHREEISSRLWPSAAENAVFTLPGFRPKVWPPARHRQLRV